MAVTTPAASAPEIPPSPGYIPSTFSTSRKFTPAARTSTRTCLAPSGPPGVLAPTARPSKVPRSVIASRQSAPRRQRQQSCDLALASRGTSTRPPRTANSAKPAPTPAATSSPAPASASTSASTNRPGFSDSADRTKPATAAPRHIHPT